MDDDNQSPTYVTIDESWDMAGLARSYEYDTEMAIADQWGEFNRLVDTSYATEDAMYGLCSELPEGNGIEYTCAIRVDGVDSLPEEFSRRQISPQAYAVFLHQGHISSIRATINAVWKKWLPASEYELNPEGEYWFERYGPSYNAESGEGDVEIWVPVKERE